MTRPRQHPRTASVLALIVATTAVATAAGATATPRATAGGHPAGVVNGFVLASTVNNEVYDVAARADGRAYIGWIASTPSDSVRHVHLCTLPPGASSCLGGIQTVTPPDTDPVDLHVVVTSDDVAHLVWFEDTSNSINGAHGAAIYQATAPHGQNLSPATAVVSDAPSFGDLLDAEAGPGGSIWTVTYSGVPARQLEVRTSISGPATTVHTPYAVGPGLVQLAFASGTPVLAVEKYGAISTALHYATRSSGGTWSTFHTLAKTWTGAGATLQTTRHGLRVVTGVNNASYRPVIAKWTGTGFGARALTADNNNCSPSTHDGRADPSGRLLDAAWECSRVTLSNYADALHAAIVRFSVSKTPTFAPQVASGTRGIATVVYSYEVANGDAIRVAHVRLPGSTVTVGRSTSAGRVTVTGPRSCLPPVNVHVGWTHHPASGWTFKSGTLRLGATAISGSTLDGARLAAGKQYTLTGSATFARNGTHRAVKKALTFATCGTG